MEALDWIKTQLFNVFTPAYSAHLNAQRQQVAENAERIRALKETQQKFRLLLSRIGQTDADLGASLTELAQNAQKVEQATQGVIAVVVEEDQVLEKAWPQVEQEVQLLLRWIKFNEPDGVARQIDTFLEEHHRSFAQGLQVATLQAQVDRVKAEAAKLETLHQRAASVAENLHVLATRVAKIAADKLNGVVKTTDFPEVVVKS